MVDFVIRHIRTFQELDKIERSWKELENIDNGPTIFQSWMWNRTWCKHFLSKQGGAYLDVRVIEDSAGVLIAILPLFTKPLAGSAILLTQFLGHRMSFHNDVLLRDPKDSDLANKLIDALLCDLSYRNVLHLGNLDGRSRFTELLFSRKAAEPQCQRVMIKNVLGSNDHWTLLKKKKRKNLRWCQNKLQREFGIDYCVKCGDDFLEAFDELICLHRQRFDSIKRATLLTGRNLEFLREATSALSNSGSFEIVQLRAAGKTIAAALMTLDRKCYYCVQAGFSPEFSRFSPMMLLLNETIRRGFEELECKLYDFGAGYEQYKYSWSPSVGTNYFVSIGGPGPYAKAFNFFYRRLFKQKLPPSPPVSQKDLSI